jgi:hypothetical protein
MPHRLRASRLRRQVSETYHGTLTRLRVGARERYHKLSDLGLTGLPNVTKEAATQVGAERVLFMIRVDNPQHLRANNPDHGI